MRKREKREKVRVKKGGSEQGAVNGETPGRVNGIGEGME